MLLRQVPEVAPEGIGGDGGHVHGLAPVDGRAARAHAFADRDPVDDFVVGLREARGRPVA